MKILICEDEEILLTSLEYRLRRNGFQAILAKDGKEALALLGQEQPNLIVADILMPNTSGMEMLTIIRQDMKLDIPVIVMSALDDDEVVLEAFRRGANDFIAKPFKPAELVLRIKRQLHLP